MMNVVRKGVFGATSLGLLGYLTEKQRSNGKMNLEAKCCGIIGYVGKNQNADAVLCQGIDLLQNRGYDSAGISTLHSAKILTSKLTSNFKNGIDCIKEIKNLARSHVGSSLGIAHTRWATCGERTDPNSHPHLDQKNRISLVHNGTIFNYMKLKSDLLAKGYSFRSETDSEVIAVKIGYFLDQGETVLQAIEHTVNLLEGTWGIVLISKEHPNSLFCCRKGSPLLIGIDDQAFYIASEAIAFQAYTNKIVRVKENECMEVALDEKFSAFVKDRVIVADKVEVKTTPSPGFDSFFLEEIYEQPEAVNRATNYLKRLVPEIGSARLGGFDSNKETALKIKTLFIVASGTSYNAALYGAYLFRSMKLFDAVLPFVASEFHDYDIVNGNTGVILLTQSGETADVLKAAKITKTNGAICIGVSNAVGSMITTVCDFGVFINSGREISVAATKSFTCMVAVLYLIAIWYSYHRKKEVLSENRQQLVDSFSNLSSLIRRTIDVCRSPAQQLAERLSKLNSIFILGKDAAFAIAREGSLKIKEVTYIHAEAIQAGEIKHGPIAMIENDFDKDAKRQTHIILIAIRSVNLEEIILAINEVKSRLAYTIVITDCSDLLDKKKIDFLIEIPENKFFSPMLAVIPLQLITYEIAKVKKVDIDRPRNLAKAVTVL